MLTTDKLSSIKNNYQTNDTNILLSNIISSNSLSKLSHVRKVNQKYSPVYNVSVKPHLKVTNQKSSGRCWLFAALNVIREKFVRNIN